VRASQTRPQVKTRLSDRKGAAVTTRSDDGMPSVDVSASRIVAAPGGGDGASASAETGGSTPGVAGGDGASASGKTGGSTPGAAGGDGASASGETSGSTLGATGGDGASASGETSGSTLGKAGGDGASTNSGTTDLTACRIADRRGATVRKCPEGVMRLDGLWETARCASLGRRRDSGTSTWAEGLAGFLAPMDSLAAGAWGTAVGEGIVDDGDVVLLPVSAGCAR
jgi:hypothetical protein